MRRSPQSCRTRTTRSTATLRAASEPSLGVWVSGYDSSPSRVGVQITTPHRNHIGIGPGPADCRARWPAFALNLNFCRSRTPTRRAQYVCIFFCMPKFVPFRYHLCGFGADRRLNFEIATITLATSFLGTGHVHCDRTSKSPPDLRFWTFWCPNVIVLNVPGAGKPQLATGQRPAVRIHVSRDVLANRRHEDTSWG